MAKFNSVHDIISIPAPVDRAFIELWHGTQPGFGVRIMRAHRTTGAVRRTYLCQYITTEGKAGRKEGLGLVDEIGYEDAIDLVRKKRASLRHQKRTGEAPPVTLNEAFRTYMTLKAEEHAPDTIDGYEKKWRYLQEWYDMPAAQLDARFWQERYLKLTVGSASSARTSKQNTPIPARTGRPTALAVLRIAHAVYGMLEATEQVRKNPLSLLTQVGLFRRSTPKQDYIKAKDLPRFWQWLHGHAHPCIRDFMLVELFMGFRVSLVAGLEWEHYDHTTGTYEVLPEVRGNKAKVLQPVPIPEYLQQMVFHQRYASRGAEPYIIPSNKIAGKSQRHIGGSFEALCGDTGIRATNHTLRRTYSTIGHSVVNLLTMARLMTHSPSPHIGISSLQQTSDYVIEEDDETRRAQNKIATEILRRATA